MVKEKTNIEEENDTMEEAQDTECSNPTIDVDADHVSSAPQTAKKKMTFF
jgi:hypothetical protein